MNDTLNLLFLTDFQEPSYRVIPAISHFAAEVKTSLTIMHIYAAEEDRRDAESDVQSFFAEAEHYAGCRRIAAQGDVKTVVEEYCKTNKPDLVIAPAGQRFQFPPLAQASLRASLLEKIPAPLWTFTARVTERSELGPIRNVACYVDFESDNIAHVEAAAQLALRFNAKLQLLHVVPTIHEGSLGLGWDSDRPLHPDVAEQKLYDLLSPMHRGAEFHVGVGSESSQLPELVEQSRADVLFVGEGQALGRSLLGKPTLRSIVKRSPCPVICFDGAACEGATWNLQASERVVSAEAPLRELTSMQG
jgi:nucleotide-binding universal stress UspA family protein